MFGKRFTMILAVGSWGNAAGAVTVPQAGTQPSLPTRLEGEALLSQARAEQILGVELGFT